MFLKTYWIKGNSFSRLQRARFVYIDRFISTFLVKDEEDILISILYNDISKPIYAERHKITRTCPFVYVKGCVKVYKYT